MKLRQVNLLLVLVSLATAQTAVNSAQIQKVKVSRSGNEMKVEVILTTPVQPNVIVATHPDRLVLELPHTSSNAKQQRVPVNVDGLKAVRIGLNSADPPVTRVVIDLENARPFGLETMGNTVTLTILPGSNMANGRRKGAPAPAAGGSLLERLRPRRQETLPSVADTKPPAPITPPPALPPLQFPEGQANPQAVTAATRASSAKPSASHPNFGSLQQGTVFPNMGAPGTGYVPPPAGQSSNTSAFSGETNTPKPSAPPATSPAVAAAVPRAPSQSVSQTAQTTTSTSGPGLTSGSAAGRPAVSTPAPAAPTQQVASAGTTRSIPSTPPTPATASEAPIPAPPARAARALVTTPLTPPATPAPSTPPSMGSPAESALSMPQQTGSTTTTAMTSAPVPSSPPAITSPSASAQSAPVRPPAVVSPAAATSAAINPSGAVPEATTPEAAPSLAIRQPNEDVRMAFKVKYVAEGVAYLDGGRSSGLSEGMKLEVRDTDPASARPPRPSAQGKVIAELDVISVAEISAVTDIRAPQRDVKAGDWAYLSAEDTQALIAQRSLSATRKYPAVISFTEGDPLEEEARAEVPRPPLPEINRARGRFGFDYSGIRSHEGSGMLSSTIGLSVRTDITRIGGTYWNLSGYWRGRLTSTSAGSQPTLQDLINRTYHLGLTYDNPQSHWVAGVGRLYLPWATSLDTIDGGYFGRRVVPGMILGLFAGSTPDPTSWSYSPDRRIGGTFVNFQGGSFDHLRYTSTSGIGISTLKWKIDRPFIFFENGFYYKRYLGIYSAVQADSPAGNPAVTAPGPGLSRNFLTVRIQPVERLEFDLNHTYFRDIPTFDPALIGTGLLDRYLFQGYSAGTRVEVVKQIWVYSTLGRSNRSGDSSTSLNELFGVTFNRLPWIRVRADAHYSRFNSSFGSGTYEALSLSRNFHDNFRWEILAGQQDYVSTVATSSNSHFVTGNLEAPLGPHYFFQGGFTWNRGGTMNYEQWLFSIGYRFDTRSKKQ